MPSGVAAVIAAAGSGRRIGGAVPKQWRLLGGIPLIAHSFRLFDAIATVDRIALALDDATLGDPARLAFLRSTHGKRVQLVKGGTTRQESVWNALRALDPAPEIVMVHDAARAFPPVPSILAAIAAARVHGGAILARPVTDTIKRVDAQGRVVETCDRSALRAAQTPQVFRFAELVRAYEKAGERLAEFTDDAGIFEAAGLSEHHGICVIESATPNEKITHPEDFERAERQLAQETSPCESDTDTTSTPSPTAARSCSEA